MIPVFAMVAPHCTFRLHLHNGKLLEQATSKSSSVHKEENVSHVDKFGFHVTTCCGYLPQDNTWEETWPVRSLRSEAEYLVNS